MRGSPVVAILCLAAGVALSVALPLPASKFERRGRRPKNQSGLQPWESIVDFSTPQDLPPAHTSQLQSNPVPQHVTQAYTPTFDIHPLGAPDQHRTHTLDPPTSDRPNKRPKTDTKTKTQTTEKRPRPQPAPEAPPLQGPFTGTHHEYAPGPGRLPSTSQKKQLATPASHPTGPLPGTGQQPATPAPPPTGPPLQKKLRPPPPTGPSPAPVTSQTKLPAPAQEAPPSKGPYRRACHG